MEDYEIISSDFSPYMPYLLHFLPTNIGGILAMTCVSKQKYREGGFEVVAASAARYPSPPGWTRREKSQLGEGED